MTCRSPRSRKTALALAAAVVAGAALPLPAQAASCSWIPTTGNWAVLANWLGCAGSNGNPAGVPGSNDSASIGASGQVTVNTTQNVGSLGNAGQITVDGTSFTISGSASVNTGTIGAINSGSFRVGNLLLTNTGGTLSASGAGSVVALGNGGTVYGGTISTSSGGVFRSDDNINARIGGALTISSGSTVRAGNNSFFYLGGQTANDTITNNGDLRTGSTGAISAFILSSNATLAGSGTLTLQDASNGQLRDDFGGRVLTNSAGHTIHGSGQIGAGTVLSLANQGTVSANQSGQVLLLNGGAVTNTGTLQAASGGTLLVGSLLVTNTGGSVSAGTGSTVALGNNATIYGGTISSSGTGVVRTNDGINARIGGALTIAAGSTVRVGNNTFLYLGGQTANDTLTNHGDLRTGATGSVSALVLNSNATLAGSGTVTLQDASNGQLRDDFGGRVLTNSASHTIQGTGNLGAGTTLSIANAGTITANATGAALTVQTTSGIVNTGLVKAENGGTLELTGSSFIRNTGATITSAAGSTVGIGNGVTLFGGTLSGSGAFVQRNSVNSRLSGTQFGTLNTTNIADPMTIAPGTTVTAGLGSNLAVDGTITNNGTLATGANAGNSSWILVNTTGGVTFNGSGAITLQDGANATIRDDFNGRTFTNGAGHTVQGYGNVGGGTTLNYVNNGLTTANMAGRTLTIQSAVALANNGELRAENGGTLSIFGSQINNGGQINAVGTNSTVLLASNGTIVGGQMNGSGGGVIRTADFTNSRISGVTLGSGAMLTVGTSANLYVDGTITNNGTLATNASAGNSSWILVNTAGGVTFNGSGAITLQDGANATIRDDFNGRTFTNSAGHTVQGYGNVGGGTTLNFVNNGLTTANVAGRTLTIQSAVALANNGELRAENGGTLTFLGSQINNGGQINAVGSGSTVLINSNATIVGGQLNGSGGGAIRTAGSTNSRISGVTIGSGAMLTVGTSANLYVDGTITNNGTLATNANTGNTSLILVNTAGGATFNGSGVITLQDAANAVIRDDFTGRSFTNGAGHTVQGVGSIGGGTTLGFTNNGLVTANVNSGTLLLSSSTAFTNAATLRAENGGILQVGSIVLNNAGGTVEALAGSTVRLSNGATVNNGLLSTTGSGVITTVSGGTASIAGLTNQGTFNVVSNSTLNLNGNLVNNGTLTLLTTPGNNTTLQINGARSITGTGTLRLTDNSQNNNFLSGTGTLTNGAGHTIEGGGGGISFSALSLVNNGTVRSTSTAGGTRLFLNPSAGSVITNNGTFASLPGGHLEVSGARLSNLSGSTLTGGTYIVGDQGSATQSILRISGANIVTNRANIQLDGAGATFSNAAGVIGISTGVHTALTNFATNDTAGSFTVRNGANFTTVGNFSNAGQLTAGPGASTFSTGAFGLANTGSIHANGGTISTTALTGPTGSALISGTGVLSTTAASSVGTLTHNGSAANGVSIGANLVVHSDYANANFGVGNAFNARANVSGAGQIVGNNASQTITGQVVNTGTNTFTLDLGNVRGGTSVTRSFQVQNNGSGASIRGAVQNAAVNDARLSGTALVAGGQNFGPLAAGSSSGNLSVTFNASSGGSLAGQSLAVVSNFSNVATQSVQLSGLASQLAVGNATQNGGAALASPVNLGNFRVGGTAPSTSVQVSNTVAPGAGAERLGIGSVSTSGNFAASNNLGAGFVLAGASQAGAVGVSVANGTAGLNTGTLSIQYTTNGVLIDPSFTTQNANLQGPISLSANGYVAAAGAIQTAALNFGNVQVGQAVSRNLVIRNTASGPSGFVEDLNASFGAKSGTGVALFSGSGSLSGILAGQDSNAANGTMTVSVDTSAPGAINGSIRVNFASAGAVAGTSNGLGSLAVGGADYGVNGSISANVIDAARPVTNGVASPNAVSVNFGNVRVSGTALSQSLTVQNQSSGAAQQGALNATIASNGAPVSAAGSFNGLTPGNSSSALSVGLDRSSAGARSGSASIAFVSDITAFGNCAPNCTLNLAPQAVNVSANVYRLANPQLNAPSSFNVAARVGDAVSVNLPVSISNASPDIYTEGLKVSISGSSGNAQGSGTIANLAAQGTDSASIKVGLLSTATAGSGSGQVNLAFVSTGAGTTGAADVAATAAAGSVTVNSNVYTAAIGTLSSGTAIDFGTRRVGSSFGDQNVTVKNDAAVTALNDTLRATLMVSGAGFGGNGAFVADVGAQQSSVVGPVTLSSATAGFKTGSASVSFQSENPELAALDLQGSPQITLTGTVNALANPLFSKSSGGASFGCVALVCTLDFGTLNLNGPQALTLLSLSNAIGGPADDLLGDFDLAGLAGFGASGFGAVNLAAGASQGNLALSFLPSATGQFSGSFSFAGRSHNAFQDDLALSPITFRLRANVVDDNGIPVPEPGTLALVAAALAAAGWRRRRIERS